MLVTKELWAWILVHGCHQNQLEKIIKKFLRELFSKGQQPRQKKIDGLQVNVTCGAPSNYWQGVNWEIAQGSWWAHLSGSIPVMAMIIMEKSFPEGRAKSWAEHWTKSCTRKWTQGRLKIFGIQRMGSITMATSRDIKIATATSAICLSFFLFLNGNVYFGYFIFYHMCLSSTIFIKWLNLPAHSIYLNTYYHWEQKNKHICWLF